MNELLFYVLLMVLLVLLPIIPAVILYRVLPSSAIVSGPFRGLNVRFTGGFGGYFVVFVGLLGLILAGPQPAKTYEVWEINGNVAFENPNDKLVPSYITVNPPTLEVNPVSGPFRFYVPVKLNQAGRLEFPS
jgi:hypothetical protein